MPSAGQAVEKYHALSILLRIIVQAGLFVNLSFHYIFPHAWYFTTGVVLYALINHGEELAGLFME